MVFLSLSEMIDIIVMSAFVGYIFMDSFGVFRKKHPYEFQKPGFDWQSFKFAMLITAPAIILHEFGHKFLAMSFGMSAQFHAAYFWLVLGLIMKLTNFGFVFFVPAYVSIIGNATPIVHSMVAFAGPAVNLLLWLGATIMIKTNAIKRKHLAIAYLTKKINMFLFIFNMLPIPPFDGFTVFSGLIRLIGALF